MYMFTLYQNSPSVIRTSQLIDIAKLITVMIRNEVVLHRSKIGVSYD